MQLKEIDHYFPEPLTEEQTNRLIVFRPINQKDFKCHYLFDPVTDCRDRNGLTLKDIKFHGVKGLPRGLNIFMSKEEYEKTIKDFGSFEKQYEVKLKL